MPQCKRNYCRKPAIPGGKRYCAEHLAEYKSRRDASLSLPRCDTCGGDRTRQVHPYTGEPECPPCAARRELQEEHRGRVATLYRVLDTVATLEELKHFIAFHILPMTHPTE